MQKKKTKTKSSLRRKQHRIEYNDNDDTTEYVYDEITGGRMKKPVMSLLNKSKLSKYEMDDLFNSWD